MIRIFRLENLLYFLLGGEVLYLCLSGIPSSDLFLHLAVGRYIVLQGEIPRHEFFSYTAVGAPWLDHEWLARVIFYKIWETGGLALLQVFKIIMVLAAFFTVTFAARKRGAGTAAPVIAACITALCARGDLFFDVRPYIFSYLLLAVFILLLEIYNTGKKNWPLYIMPFLIILWANLHAAFPAAFLLMGAYLAAYGWQMIRRKGGISKFLPLLGSMIACGIATLVNPYGWHLWEFPFKFLSVDFYRLNLNEWAPPGIAGGELPFFILLGLIIIMFILLKPRRIEDGIIIAVFGILGLSSVRHLPVFAIVVIPAFASSLSILGQKIKWKIPRLPGWEIVLSAIGIFLILLFSGLKVARADLASLSLEKEMFPGEAVRFLAANHLDGRMFEPYEWGGYIMWKLYPRYKVFMDGRANTVYPDELYRQALSVMFGMDGYERILSQQKVDIVLCNRLQVSFGHKIPELLGENSKWEKIYEDDVSVLFLRRKPFSEKVIKPAGGFEYHESYYTLSEEGRDAVRKGSLKEAENLLLRSLELNPGYVPAWIDLGVVLGSTGRVGESAECFKEALRLDPGIVGARYNLARYYEIKGDIKKARRLLINELKLNPDYKPAKDALEALSE